MIQNQTTQHHLQNREEKPIWSKEGECTAMDPVLTVPSSSKKGETSRLKCINYNEQNLRLLFIFFSFDSPGDDILLRHLPTLIPQIIETGKSTLQRIKGWLYTHCLKKVIKTVFKAKVRQLPPPKGFKKSELWTSCQTPWYHRHHKYGFARTLPFMAPPAIVLTC